MTTTANGIGGLAQDTRTFSPRQFVFRPGGTRSGNVYTDFSELYTDLDGFDGPKELIFDDSLVSPCIIPAGTYDFSDVPWKGTRDLDFANNQVTFAVGAVCTGVRYIENLVLLQTIAGTGIPLRYLSGTQEILWLFQSQIAGVQPGENAILGVTGGTTLIIYCYDQSGMTFNTAPALELLTAADTVEIYLYSGSGVVVSDIGGPAGSNLTIKGDGTQGIPTSFASFLGTYTREWLTKADRVEVNPSGLSVVTSDNVQGAIAELDAASGGGGGSGGAPEVFVYRPGGVAGGNVYTNFGLLMTDLNAATGRKYLVWDDSVTSPITIPAGGPYDFSDTVWMDDGTHYTFPFTTINFQAGVTISNPPIGFRGLRVEMPVSGVPTPFVYTTNIQVFLVNSSLRISAIGANPLISSSASSFGLDLWNSSLGNITPSGEVWDHTGANFITLDLHDGSSIGINTISTIGGSQLSVRRYDHASTFGSTTSLGGNWDVDDLWDAVTNFGGANSIHQLVELRPDTAHSVEVIVTAHEETGNDSATWIIRALVEDQAGVRAIVGQTGTGAPTFSTGGAAAGWTATLSLSGAWLRVNLTAVLFTTGWAVRLVNARTV